MENNFFLFVYFFFSVEGFSVRNHSNPVTKIADVSGRWCTVIHWGGGLWLRPVLHLYTEEIIYLVYICVAHRHTPDLTNAPPSALLNALMSQSSATLTQSQFSSDSFTTIHIFVHFLQLLSANLKIVWSGRINELVS